jgi:hypothetical protein
VADSQKMPQFSYSFYTHRPRAPAEDIRKTRNEKGMFCASAVAKGSNPHSQRFFLFFKQRTTRAARSDSSKVEWKS